MATLVSPGVSVTIIGESAYGTSGQGTVPLLFIATETNKLDPSGTAIAEGTKPENAGKLTLVGSQRELVQYFGEPKFYEANGTQMHGYELNEYGLLAAYSFLGISNRAYVVRADLNLAELAPSSVAPVGLPQNGQYWLDASESIDGLFRYNASNQWENVNVKYIWKPEDMAPDGSPVQYYPAQIGDYVWVLGDTPSGDNRLFIRTSTGWDYITSTNSMVGVYSFQVKSHTQYPTTRPNASPLQVGDLWLKSTTPNSGAKYALKRYSIDTGSWANVSVPILANDDAASNAYGLAPTNRSVYGMFENDGANQYGSAITLKIHNGKATNDVVSSNPNFSFPAGPAGQLVINGLTPIAILQNDSPLLVASKINSETLPNIVASVSAAGELIITHTAGLTISLAGSTNIAVLGFSSGPFSNWSELTYVVSDVAPTTNPVSGRLWYNNDILVDIMENNGTTWVNRTSTLFIQSDIPVADAIGDLWVDTDQQAEYPVIYRAETLTDWVRIDNTDQTTPFGIIFADARVSPTSTLDADAPDALLYPAGMLLWNTRYSTGNVKRWVPNYTFEGVVVGDRWVNESGNDFDGSPLMGRNAVKKVITEKIAATIQSNEDIRSETFFYNLIAAPGFPELIDEMIALNVDRKETAFVVGDSPFRLKATANELSRWATNANNAASNGDKGLITANPYLGVYYPSGLSTNLDGSEVVVPASHMALRTYAYNDQVAYPWFAPAGYNRGIVSNAVSVGYIDDEDEYVPVQLGEGLRDTLYINNVNPIASIPNRGIVVYGQKTRSSVATALDRVNVARLVNYIRYQADLLARPFLFEPNDAMTRKNVTAVFERFLSELVTLRGISDFAVDCSEGNNTPARIDRNELWVDLAVAPTKAIEFIYIPVRIVNTGVL